MTKICMMKYDMGKLFTLVMLIVPFDDNTPITELHNSLPYLLFISKSNLLFIFYLFYCVILAFLLCELMLYAIF